MRVVDLAFLPIAAALMLRVLIKAKSKRNYFVGMLPVMLALVGIWHYQISGYPTRAVLPYDNRLSRLPAYLQQLEMESNGKRVSMDGSDLPRPSGPVVWGEPGTNGGPPGDLYIEIRLKKHDIFERDGDDLHCQVPVSFITAALGGEIEVPTLAGKAAIDIPEGTQAGKQFRLRGKGIKGVRASYPGDLYCHIAVETPVKLTEHQRKLLRELEDSLKKGGGRHSPSGESWTDRLKNFFS